MSSRARFTAFDQLSSREKTLVSGLALTVFAVVVLAAWFIVNGLVSELEEETEYNRDMIAQIEDAAATYAHTKARCDALAQAVADNAVASLRVPVNNVARGITLAEGGNLSNKIGSLDKEVETPIGAVCAKRDKKAPKKKKKREEGDVVRIEQDFEFKQIPMDAIYEFLEGVEAAGSLLFVTRLEVKRSFGDADLAQLATVRVATYKSEGGP